VATARATPKVPIGKSPNIHKELSNNII
jgi:hypothetical protein